MNVMRTPVLFFAVMTVLLGLVYPGAVWFVGHVFAPGRADGSLIYHRGGVVGSELIGQSFTHPAYFWPRPSATGGKPYNAMASRASHLNPAHPDLAIRVKGLREKYAKYGHVPVDLVTSSASGLDPDISLEGAKLQVARVAAARGLTQAQIFSLIDEVRSGPTFGFIGQERVNVVRLNFLLDSMHEAKK